MKKPIITPTRFSEHFGLKVNSDELDFVDIYANQDITLFIDPYGISAIGSKWSFECEQQITGFFQYLVDSIRNKDKKVTQKLLNALHEVDEVSLGFSLNQPKGKGIGKKQAIEIQTSFENSQAVKSGDIKDIADCALMIPGINRDKISDITANIIKKKLIEFTLEQCKKHGIPTKRVAVNNTFDFEHLTFTSFYANLPVINEKAKILLPITSVRRDPQLSKDKYYRNFVIEFLKAEHQHAGDSLAYVLRNGKIKVRIADLKAKYPLGADFLYNFSKEHPNVLEKYKAELRKTAHNKNIPLLEQRRKVLSAKERMNILENISIGKEDAYKFNKISFDNLIQIFGIRLSNPDSEVKINDERKRIDIVFNNSNNKGFFNNLNKLYHIHCPKIIVECKNYGREIGNPEIDQLQGRLNKRRGLFGILVCRSILDKKSLLQRCKDVLHDDMGYIIVLDDIEIGILLKFQETGNENQIDDFLTQKLDELLM